MSISFWAESVISMVNMLQHIPSHVFELFGDQTPSSGDPIRLGLVICDSRAKWKSNVIYSVFSCKQEAGMCLAKY